MMIPLQVCVASILANSDRLLGKIGLIFTLLVIFQIKHFLADFPLQGKYMMGKFKPGLDFILPLLAHSVVHGVLTFAISYYFTTDLGFSAELMLIDVVIHGLMDRSRASPGFKVLSGPELALLERNKAEIEGLRVKADFFHGKYKAALRSNTLFWWSLGMDQMVHHLTHYLLIYLIVFK